MFGIGGAELFIIIIFVFLVVGPDKLPEAARIIGKAIGRFRTAQQDMKEVLGDEKLVDLDNPDEPIKNPIEVMDRVVQRQQDKKAAKSAASSKEQKPSTTDSKSSDQIGSKSASNESSSSQKSETRESFSERKARYERERAARKAEEEAEEEAVSEAAEVEVIETAEAAESVAQIEDKQTSSSSKEGGEN